MTKDNRSIFMLTYFCSFHDSRIRLSQGLFFPLFYKNKTKILFGLIFCIFAYQPVHHVFSGVCVPQVGNHAVKTTVIKIYPK